MCGRSQSFGTSIGFTIVGLSHPRGEFLQGWSAARKAPAAGGAGPRRASSASQSIFAEVTNVRAPLIPDQEGAGREELVSTPPSRLLEAPGGAPVSGASEEPGSSSPEPLGRASPLSP